VVRRIRNSKGRFIKKSRKASRRRRRNGSGLGRAGFLAAMAAGKKKSRKGRKASRKGKVRSGRRIRPVILVSKSGGYRRPRRSKYFTRPRMVNGRRRRRNGGGSLMSVVKKTFTVATVSGYLAIGGGIFAGALLSRMLNTGLVPFTTTALPASVSETLGGKYVRPFQGLIHIVLGGLIAAKVKNKHVQNAGLGLAALGGYDLLSQALTAVGMTALPTFAGMNVDLLGGRTSYTGMNVNLLGGGMNVDLMGNDARSTDAESNYLADNINDMIS